MSDDREERIRRRAHELWEGEGSPDGRDADHWLAAESEIGAETEPPAIREGRDATDDASLAASPGNEDAKLDVGLDESFPASDPPAQTVPAKEPKAGDKSPLADPGSPGGTSGTGGTTHDQDR